MPSRSSGTTAARPSGSPSPSTASWPTTRRSKDELLADGDNHLARNTDTEIIMHSLATSSGPRTGSRLVGVSDDLRTLRRRLQPGPAHGLGDMVVARDPLGIPAAVHRRGRPAVRRGQRKRGAVQPGFPQHPLARAGTLAVADPSGVRIERFAPSPQPGALFLRMDLFRQRRQHDGRPQRLSRRSGLGEELARLEDVPIDDDTIVVPVPDTSKAAADAMAFELKVPSVEGLIRNRYTGRTFIEGTADRAPRPNQVHAAAGSAWKASACSWSRTRSSARRP